MMIAGLQAPLPGHTDAVTAVIGCTPLEALTGPLPPGYGVMAVIAAPMLGDDRAVAEVAADMAAAGSEHEWRDALRALFEAVIDE